ncbi:protein of unknown function [Methylorubrum extorquens]|uniref:Uncharacterized protein n=1 Tax=Methylorubrum extorquens TaxID=408 RepID=A0A2N9AMA0_METEX|nr:protein of unknown function [Methylorubrum extorquens]
MILNQSKLSPRLVAYNDALHQPTEAPFVFSPLFGCVNIGTLGPANSFLPIQTPRHFGDCQRFHSSPNQS